MRLSAMSRVAAMVLLLWTMASAGAQASDKVRLVVLPFLSQAPIFIALEEGHFAREGIEIERVSLQSSYLAVPGLMSGELDAAIPQASAGLFNAIARGGAARYVAPGVVLSPGGCSYTALYGSGITLAELANGSARQVSVAADAIAFEGFLVDLMRRLPGAERLTFVHREMPVQAQQAALASRALDLAFTGEPWLTRFDDARLGRIVAGAEQLLPDAQYTGLMLSRRLLVERPDLGQRFTRAFTAAVRQYNEGKTPRNLDIVARGTRLAPDQLARSCWPVIPADGRVRTEGLMQFQAWLLERRAIDRIVPAAEFVAAPQP
jgi:NitT/TauT family transport system substrate-binding protein